MAKNKEITQVKGKVNRISLQQTDTTVYSVMLMLEGDPRMFELTGPSPALYKSLRLTKPGDDVRFVVLSRHSVFFGKSDSLVAWTNCSIALEQEKTGARPRDCIENQDPAVAA